MVAGDTGELTVPYLIWCLRADDDVIIVDTGFTPAEGIAHGVRPSIGPEAALARLDLDSREVACVVVTHAHWDHFSALEHFPRAMFTLQRADFDFFSGPHSKYPTLMAPACDMERVWELRRGGRLKLIDGDHDFAPGVRLVKIGGHSPGSQAVVVESANRGRVVICADTIDTYRNLELDEPTPRVTSRIETVVGYARLRGLVAGDTSRLFPGHDTRLFSNGWEVGEDVFAMG